MRLALAQLEDRSLPANLIPAGEFNWLQATPTGGLAELVWSGRTLTYRTRAGLGWDAEPIVVDTGGHGNDTYDEPTSIQRATQAAQLAFTSDGTPHAFLLSSDIDAQFQFLDQVQHYQRGTAGWSLVDTISLGSVGSFFSTSDNLTSTVGPGGVFHLLVSRTTQNQGVGTIGQGQLLYVTNRSGSWTSEPTVTTGDLSNDITFGGQRYVPRFLSIAADSQNFAHIAYTTGFFSGGSFSTVTSSLGYATNRTGSWVGETVFGPPDGTGDAGLGASVAVGPGDSIAIANYFVDRVATGSPAAAQLLYHARGPAGGWTTIPAVTTPDGYVAADGPNYTGFAPLLRFEGGTPVIVFSDVAAQHLPVTFANEMAGQIRETRLLPGGWATQTIFRQDNPLVNEVYFPIVALFQGQPVYAGLRAVNTLNGNLDILSTVYDLFELNAPIVDSAEPGLPGGPPGAGTVAAGAGGGPVVKVFAPDGSRSATFFAFEPGFTGGVRIATGDVNGDGTVDVIAGTGPGAPTRVLVFSGVDQSILFDLRPFESAFLGGVYVAAGDLTGDGRANLVITPDEGGGPRVTLVRGGDFQVAANFFGIDDAAFRGGARAAVGDVNGDGRADLIVAAGFGGGPRVAVFEGQSVVAGSPTRLVNDFFLFEQALRNGAFVAAGDLDGDGFAEVIGGGGPGGGPRVYALSGRDLTETGQAVPRANFFSGDVNLRGGVRVAVDDLDGDARADLLVGAGAGSGNRVSAYLGKDVAADGEPPLFRGFSAFPGFAGGVFVG